jgi:hypothetical protein
MREACLNLHGRKDLSVHVVRRDAAKESVLDDRASCLWLIIGTRGRVEVRAEQRLSGLEPHM